MIKFFSGALVGLYLFPSSLYAVQLNFRNGMDNETWEHKGKKFTNICLEMTYKSNEGDDKRVLNLPKAHENISIEIGKSPDTLTFYKVKLELLGTPENSTEPQSLWKNITDSPHCLKMVSVGLSPNPFFGIKVGEEQYRNTIAVF